MNQIEKIMALHDDAADWREAKGKDHPAAVESEQAFRTAIEQALTAKPNINCKSVQHRLATQWGYIKADDASKPVEVEPYAYIYETHGPFGLHQSLQCKPYNGVMPSRSVPVYTAPPARVDGWIPVSEKMPDPGVTVLAYYKNSHGLDRRIRATWVAAKTLEAIGDGDFGEYDENSDNYYCPEGWYERVDNWDEMSHVFVSEGLISRWMPLPPAPQPTKD